MVDRGVCEARLPQNRLRMRFKKELKVNRGYLRTKDIPVEEGKGFNYGDKNSTLEFQWCPDGKACSGNGDKNWAEGSFGVTPLSSIQTVTYFGRTAEVELLPDHTPYQVKITLDGKTTIAKCPQWDDPATRKNLK